MIELTTQRLLLRDHREEDLQSHHALFSSKTVMYFLQDIMTHSLEESRENLRQAMAEIECEQAQRRFTFLRIECRQTGGHIGEIGYTADEFTPLGKLVSVGYFIRKEHWGQGYTPEAFEALIHFAFTEGGVYRIGCGCLEEHAASQRVMQKCGLIKEATRKEYQWHEGMLKDRAEYRLLHSEWAGA